MDENIKAPLDNLIDICNRYKRDELDVLAFQKELETVYLPPQTSEELSMEQRDVHNHLEILRFTHTVEHHKAIAEPFADLLIAETLKEMERLSTYTPYATLENSLNKIENF